VIPAFPVYLFDIDGTLLDSAVDICSAVQQAMEDCPDRRPVTFEFLRGFIGKHLIDTFQACIPECTPEQTDRLIQQYRSIYLGRGHKQTRVYPGVVEGLSKLAGRKTTATTKGTPTTRAVLEQFGLLHHFDHVQGTDNGIPYKPAPDVLLAAMAAIGARPEECLMVGDSAADMEAGKRAGVKTCAVRYGYGNPEDLARFEPDYWVDDLRELAAVSRAL
jgi:HAD superfamily hydrolase (TIGR01509 family)